MFSLWVMQDDQVLMQALTFQKLQKEDPAIQPPPPRTQRMSHLVNKQTAPPHSFPCMSGCDTHAMYRGENAHSIPLHAKVQTHVV